MDPDQYQQAWQAQTARTRVTVHADLLLRELLRNQRDFKSTIFRRDMVELATAILLLPYWFYAGITYALPWTWYLTVPALLWVIGFVLVDRARHKRTPVTGEPLLRCVQESLTRVEHQIWLLRNVFWWYLLPFAIPLLAFFTQSALLYSEGWFQALIGGAGLFAFLFGLYFSIDYINQRAVRNQLEPRRLELLALLADLVDDPTDAPSRVTEGPGIDLASIIWRWIVVAIMGLVALAAIVLWKKAFEISYDGPPRNTCFGGTISPLTQRPRESAGAAPQMTATLPGRAQPRS